MITKVKFIFINKNNHFQESSLETTENVEQAGLTRRAIDRFRQLIGNYWFVKNKNKSDSQRKAKTKPDSVDPLIMEKVPYSSTSAELKFQREVEIPFDIRLGKTYKFFDKRKTPATAKITPITLVAKTEVFGPYPDCQKCWYRYIFGEDFADASQKYETIFGYKPLRLQDVESGIIGTRGKAYRAKRLGKTPLAVLLLSDAGLPDASRMDELGINEVRSAGEKIRERLLRGFKGKYGLNNVKMILFEDYYFANDLPKPGFDADSNDTKKSGTLQAEVSSEYNYYPPAYEDYITSNKIPETRLANVYSLAANKGTVPVIYKLKNEIECLERKLIFMIQANDIKVLLTPGTSLPLINKFYPFQSMVPYYANIKLDKETSGPLGTSIEQQRLDGAILRHMSEIPPVDRMADYKIYKQVDGVKRGNNRGKVSGLVLEDPEHQGTLNSWEYYEWILKFFDNIKELSFDKLPDGTVFLSQNTNESVQNAINTNTYYSKMMRLVGLVSQINNTIHQYSRDYTQLIRGSVPYKEIIAYRIAKHITGNSQGSMVYNSNDLLTDSAYSIIESLGEPIQNFWFFNSTQEQLISYVDSQIKDNTNYTYVIYAYPMVVGSEYFYSNVGKVKIKRPEPEKPPPPEETPCDQLGDLPWFSTFVDTRDAEGVETFNYSLFYLTSLLTNYTTLLTSGVLALESLKQALEISATEFIARLEADNRNNVFWTCNEGVITCEVQITDKGVQELLVPRYGDQAYLEIPRITSQLTRLMVLCLDGTYFATLGVQATTVLMLALVRTVSNGNLSFKVKCNCPDAVAPEEPIPVSTGDEDPCTLMSSLTVQTSLDFTNFYDLANTQGASINDALASKLGIGIDLNNLNVEDVEEIKNKFIETLAVLSQKTGNPNIDPNTGQVAITINNYFDSLEAEGEFDLVEFVVFVSSIRMQAKMNPSQTTQTTIPNGFFGNQGSLNSFFNLAFDFNEDTFVAERSFVYEEVVSDCPDSSKLLDFDNRLSKDGPSLSFGAGLEFSYSTIAQTTCDCGSTDDTRCKVSMLATVVPKPIIFEIPYFIASTKVNNSLPIAPDVQFLPYKDVDQKILINLNTMEGQYKTQFVPILQSDFVYYDSLRATRMLDENELLEFSNDDNVLYYESFRIESQPYNYGDFASGIYRVHRNYKKSKQAYNQTVSYQQTDERPYSNSFAFDEDLEPNKKYYYIFRTVDEKKNISNPSRIFEVQMISDSGASFPIIRVVDFLKPEIVRNNREMKRFLLINPTFIHTETNSAAERSIADGAVSAHDVIQDFKFSPNLENKLWDKTFKIRITSLKSGRAIDLNINPKVNLILNEKSNCENGPILPKSIP